MIEYWKCDKGFKRLDEWEPYCWIRMREPTADEIQSIQTRFDPPDYFFGDVEDPGERPRLDYDDGWLLTVLRIPNRIDDEDGDPVFMTLPLAIMIKDDVAITICHFKPEMTDDFIRYTTKKQIESRKGNDLMLALFLSSSVWYLKYLKQMNAMMKSAEEALEEKMSNDELRNMMRIEKFLVYFITSMRGNEVVMARLRKVMQAGSYDDDLYEDVEIELQQAYATANIYSEVLERQRESYASIISNNLNSIMKRLTVLTLILMFPTCVSGFFGMNVTNGFESSEPAFYIIIVVTLISCVISYLIFKKKSIF